MTEENGSYAENTNPVKTGENRRKIKKPLNPVLTVEKSITACISIIHL